MRRSCLVLVLVAGVLALAAPALAGNGGVAPLEPTSPNAGRITDAYWLILAVTGAIFVLVEATLIVFIVRYRRGNRARTEEGEQIHGARGIEIAWTITPVVILAAIVSFVFYKLPGIEDAPAAAASDIRVHVEGHQFYWLFRYPDGRESINELVVPVGRVVNLDITAHDVIHSWWVPEFGGKIDAIPGKVNHSWFKPERAGTYTIRCVEFCGLQHQAMTGTVRVGGGAVPAGTQLGRQAVAGVCQPCHGERLEGGVGPALAGNALLNDEQSLRDIVRNGRGQMPAVGKTWDSRLLSSTIAYLKTRAQGNGTQGGGSGG